MILNALSESLYQVAERLPGQLLPPIRLLFKSTHFPPLLLISTLRSGRLLQPI